MKLRIDQAALARVVTRASRALSSRPAVPVLAGIKLDADPEGRLTAAAFDYEVSATAATAADVAEGGQVLVSGRLLADITASLPKGSEVDIAVEGGHLVLAAQAAQFTLHTMPLEEYPALPAPAQDIGTVPGAAFAETVGRVAPSACRDLTVPHLTGIKISLGGGEPARLQATDRYRLPVAVLPGWQPVLDSSDPVSLLVPAATLADASKDLAGAEAVHIGVRDGLVSLTADGYTLTTRLLEGDLPDFKKLFPARFTTVATLPAAPLAAALKRLSLVAVSGQTRPVKITLKDASATLHAGAADAATGTEQLEADVHHPAEGGAEPVGSVVFNAAFLSEAVRAIGADQVQINLVTSTKPALLHAPGHADTYQHLLMPVRLT